MPHAIVKMWPGKSARRKPRLTQVITEDVMDTLHYVEESVSVAIEEVQPRDWVEKLYKKPDYNPFD